MLEYRQDKAIKSKNFYEILMRLHGGFPILAGLNFLIYCDGRGVICAELKNTTMGEL